MKQAAEALVASVNASGAPTLVRNLETRMLTEAVGGWTIPVSRNEGHRRTCYINCPSRAFVEYGKEELNRLTHNLFARLGGEMALSALSPLMRQTGLDRQVQLNNWLVATNILPPASPDEWLSAFDRLGAKFPGHVPVLRSVNQRVNGPLLAALVEAGLTAFPLRKVFIRDYADDDRWTTDEARDADLLARSDLERRSGPDFGPEEFDRAAGLYGQLYLEKYSTLNPQYTGLFLRHAQAYWGLKLEGLFDHSGRMIGIIGRYEQHGVLTGPIVGYELTLPRKTGLYRRLRAINHAEARMGGWIYNMSAGAEGFKRLRGGQPTLEYMIADFRFARPAQRLAARTLASLSQAAARRLMSAN